MVGSVKRGVMPCSLVEVNEHSYDTTVNFYQTTWHHTSEDIIPDYFYIFTIQ